MIYAPLKLVKNVVPEIPELLDFIDKLNPELAEGKINIKNDDIFAITASYHTRKLSELVLESHQ
ncbi:MAG TPA: YhcH/YjgK/YiaL family protein, partial [Victivallales bacterium]|nr:YhcH/YjgK/YiaL family protein [Victivallales bacterium]